LPSRARTYVNGTIWTGSSDDRSPTSLTVADGRVTAVDEAPCGDVFDLAGTFLMPGFRDGHAHPILGALESRGPAIRGAESVAAVASAVADYAQRKPDDPCITGAGFGCTLAHEGRFHASWLDQAVPDRPVILRSADYHSVWCNSAALAAAGIGRDTPDPSGGRIERDYDGYPIGTLREPGAYQRVLDLTPPADADILVEAARSAARRFAAVGVTEVLDAWVDLDSGFLDAYLRAATDPGPMVRIGVALRALPDSWRQQLPLFCDARRYVERSGVAGCVSLHTVKFFVDGVLMTGTARLLEPYSDDPTSRGILTWEPRELADAVTAFDALGFDPHLHCVGDAAARIAIDAIAHAITVNPQRDRRPTVCHLQLVGDADLDRMAQLGIVANFEPFWAQHDDFDRLLTAPRLRERGDLQFPMRAALDRGVRVSFGTDWPVTTPNPLECGHVAVTGGYVGAPPDDRRGPDHRLTATEVLLANTAGVAYQLGHRGGPLVPGSRADLVQLSADPRENPDELGNIAVLGTWLGGRRTAGD
jgi:predicted amidohydrolase YtcJ